LDFEAFNEVALLVTIEVIEFDTAFEASADFVGVVFETFERADLTLV
jgi:hypothetical protein